MLTNESEIPVLNKFSEEGFADFCFRVTELVNQNNSLSILGKATYKNAPLALKVEIQLPLISAISPEGNLIQDNILYKAISFHRHDNDCDNLVHAVSELYELGNTTIKLFKVLNGQDADDNYHESYLNLDLPNNCFYWDEKDPEYRVPILKALSNSI